MQPISANSPVKPSNTWVKHPPSLRFGTHEKPLVSEKALKTAYKKGFKHTAFGIALFTALGLTSLSLIDLQVRSILKAEEKQTEKMKLDNEILIQERGIVSRWWMRNTSLYQEQQR